MLIKKRNRKKNRRYELVFAFAFVTVVGSKSLNFSAVRCDRWCHNGDDGDDEASRGGTVADQRYKREQVNKIIRENKK